MDSPLILRPMTSADLDAVVDIELTSYSRGWSRDTFKCCIEDEKSYYFVAVLDELIVGYAGIQQVLDEANLDNIAVHQHYRGRGIAWAMLTLLINKCIALEVSLVMLEVRESNTAALKLYNAFSFAVVGRREGYYTYPTEAAILMNRFIKEV